MYITFYPMFFLPLYEYYCDKNKFTVNKLCYKIYDDDDDDNNRHSSSREMIITINSNNLRSDFAYSYFYKKFHAVNGFL